LENIVIMMAVPMSERSWV